MPDENKFDAVQGGETPPAPPAEIGLRTMAGDIKSVQAGEAAPLPKEVLPPEVETLLEKPETVSQIPGPIIPPAEEKRKVSTFILLLGIVLMAAGFGIFGYFVVYPWLFPAPGVQAPSANRPSVIPLTPPVLEEPLPAAVPHVSYFVIPPAAAAEVRLSDLTSLSISTALQTEAASSPGDNLIKEVIILDQNGSRIPASDFFAALVPSITPKTLEGIYEEDLTAYLYYDSKGVWPGYVLKSAPTMTVETAGILGASLETNDNTIFYIDPPGLILQSFKGGQYKDFQTVYAVGSRPGASFNIAWSAKSDYTIISTSFDGLKAAVALLGF